MKTALIPLLALLTGCVNQANTPNPFDVYADFSAQRELETIVVRNVDQEAACAHVAHALMDLECALREVNGELGVVSATTQYGVEGYGDNFSLPYGWLACGGSDVSVSVKERDNGEIVIRATFEPPNRKSDQAFKTLLRRSFDRHSEK